MATLPLPPALVRRIGDAIAARRAWGTALLGDFVRIPSVTGEEERMGLALAASARGLGLETETWLGGEELRHHARHVGPVPDGQRWNVAARWRGLGGGRTLLLNGHLDTVAAGDADAWSVDPFGGRVRDGRLYGRGACDMKGGLVTHLVALAALADLGVRCAGDVVLLATVGEEDGGCGALSAVLHGYTADAVIITEPTQLAIIPACEGSIVARLVIEGRSSHAATRDAGVSALEKFLPVHAALLAFEAQRNAVVDHPLYAAIANKVPVNVGVVRAGTWASTVPDRLEAEIRVGILPGEDFDTVLESLRDTIRRAADRDEWLRRHPPTLELIGGQFVPAATNIDAPIIATLRAAHEGHAGHRPHIEGATYGADLRHFAHFGAMDCIMFGAGDVRHAHAPDESIDLNELFSAATTIALTIATWCGAADRPTPT